MGKEVVEALRALVNSEWLGPGGVDIIIQRKS